jgi:hypothetical protein
MNRGFRHIFSVLPDNSVPAMSTQTLFKSYVNESPFFNFSLLLCLYHSTLAAVLETHVHSNESAHALFGNTCTDSLRYGHGREHFHCSTYNWQLKLTLNEFSSKKCDLLDPSSCILYYTKRVLCLVCKGRGGANERTQDRVHNAVSTSSRETNVVREIALSTQK